MKHIFAKYILQQGRWKGNGVIYTSEWVILLSLFINEKMMGMPNETKENNNEWNDSFYNAENFNVMSKN